jgi:hypothetical protein
MMNHGNTHAGNMQRRHSFTQAMPRVSIVFQYYASYKTRFDILDVLLRLSNAQAGTRRTLERTQQPASEQSASKFLQSHLRRAATSRGDSQFFAHVNFTSVCRLRHPYSSEEKRNVTFARSILPAPDSILHK